MQKDVLYDTGKVYIRLKLTAEKKGRRKREGRKKKRREGIQRMYKDKYG